MATTASGTTETVTILAAGALLIGELRIPAEATGLIVFALGSGSTRRNPRNRQVADALHERRLATLLFDLLSAEEAAIDDVTWHLRFDIGFLAKRLVDATEWVTAQGRVASLPIGYFGVGTGAAAALVAAAALPDAIGAVVSRGGRPDLASRVLDLVRAPTLLIVGGEDRDCIALNERAFRQLASPKELVLVNRATHLVEEPETMEEVARLATNWFERFLAEPGPRHCAPPPRAMPTYAGAAPRLREAMVLVICASSSTLSRSYACSVTDLIGREDDHFLTWRDTSDYLDRRAADVADADAAGFGSPGAHDERGPLAGAVAVGLNKRATRHAHYVRRGPHDDGCLNAEAVADRRRSCIEVDDDVHALLLDSQRRELGEAGMVPRRAPGRRRSFHARRRRARSPIR